MMKSHSIENAVIVLISIFVLAFTIGCSSTGSKSDSEASAQTQNSEEAQIQGLIAKMDEAGYEHEPINNLVIDEIGQIMATQFKRQRVLLESYHEKLQQHKDVSSFLIANQGKTKEQLTAAIRDFDGKATNEAQKIGPKLDVFMNSVSEIENQNMALAKQLALTGAKIAALKDKGLDKLVAASGMQAMMQMKSVTNAFTSISDRWSVGTEANDLIEADKRKLDNLHELQKIVSTK